jgi:hypothetical protein
MTYILMARRPIATAAAVALLGVATPALAASYDTVGTTITARTAVIPRDGTLTITAPPGSQVLVLPPNAAESVGATSGSTVPPATDRSRSSTMPSTTYPAEAGPPTAGAGAGTGGAGAR